LGLQALIDGPYLIGFAVPAFQKGIATEALTFAVHLLDALHPEVVEPELGNGILEAVADNLLGE
jgi:hypothetical protein